MRGPACVLVWAVVVAATEAPANAQPFGNHSAAGTFSGTGSSEITLPANRMRVDVDLLAQGKNVKDALDGLKEREKKARSELQKLGADNDSITIGDPKLSDDNDAQIQMRQMLASRGPKGKPEKAVNVPVTVTSRLRAEWRLGSTDAGEMLIQSHDLQEKIRKADLSGSKEATKLTPEEQEVLEEMQGSGSPYSHGGSEEEPGGSSFSFVAAISDAEHEKALADAYKEAHAEAARLAKAAGWELGRLASLTGNSSSTDPASNNAYGQYWGGLPLPSRTPPDDPREAVSERAGKVTLRVTVQASFALK